MCARLPAKPCQATNQVGLICPAVHELIGLTGHVVVSWCFEVLCGARNCSGLIHGMTLLQYINSTKTGDGLSMLWIEYALYAQSLWCSLVVFGSHLTQVTRFKIIELLTWAGYRPALRKLMWIHEHEKSVANGRKLLHMKLDLEWKQEKHRETNAQCWHPTFNLNIKWQIPAWYFMFDDNRYHSITCFMVSTAQLGWPNSTSSEDDFTASLQAQPKSVLAKRPEQTNTVWTPMNKLWTKDLNHSRVYYERIGAGAMGHMQHMH